MTANISIKDSPKKDHSSKNKDKSRDRDKHNHRDKDRKRRKRDESSQLADSGDTSPRGSDNTSRYFYSDWKGDPLNIQYGGIHKGNIPRYTVVNRGRKILGLPFGWSAFARNDQGIVVGKDRHQ
ncbi:hypothetical protein MPER_06116, partial [Moniliophthora perniciosa FA553]